MASIFFHFIAGFKNILIFSFLSLNYYQIGGFVFILQNFPFFFSKISNMLKHIWCNSIKKQLVKTKQILPHYIIYVRPSRIFESR